MKRGASPELESLMDDELEMGAIFDLAAYMISQSDYDYDAEWLNRTFDRALPGVRA